jgi:hypothetical protein
MIKIQFCCDYTPISPEKQVHYFFCKGNILLLDDGRLGLIDFGQVKQFTDSQRVTFSKLIVALSGYFLLILN